VTISKPFAILKIRIDITPRDIVHSTPEPIRVMHSSALRRLAFVDHGSGNG
jgi:hypothetical protein